MKIENSPRSILKHFTIMDQQNFLHIYKIHNFSNLIIQKGIYFNLPLYHNFSFRSYMKKLIFHPYFIKENNKSKVINSNKIHKLINFLAIPERFYPQI